jgi:hypothetical protein
MECHVDFGNWHDWPCSPHRLQKSNAARDLIIADLGVIPVSFMRGVVQCIDRCCWLLALALCPVRFFVFESVPS